MKRLGLSILSLLICVLVHGQSIRDFITTHSEQKYIHDTLVTDVKFDQSYVLYRDVVRCYTWLVGVGEPISLKDAGKLPYYYRLSMKNEKGHYHLVEAMRGDKLTTEHPLSTYILSKNGETDNKDWQNKLKSIGKWMFVSDMTGDLVVEERAFEAKEKDAGLVYSMLPVRNDSTHVTISYLDAMGYPAEMNENENFIYGSVVRITYDDRGYDSVIDFLDGAGYRKANIEGADQQRYVYDSKGRILQVTSNNCVGNYAIDTSGKCGVKYSYDDEDNSYTVTYLDTNLKPMRMPAGKVAAEETFICCKIKKDKLGRKAEAVMLDGSGHNDATLSGIHKIKYEYSGDGMVTKTYFDITGNKIQ